MKRGARQLITLSVLVALLGVIPTSAGAAPATRTWLALGDSYSSGEGIPGSTTKKALGGKECSRATGEDGRGGSSNAKAYAVKAYEQVKEAQGFGSIDFVACTGAITDDVTQQIAEARTGNDSKTWDVVTFSFGGNNIKFADILYGCLNAEARSWIGLVFDGCDQSQDELKQRIDKLVGKAISDKVEFNGTKTLPVLYDDVAKVVRPGGDVVVVGYPRPVEDSSKWPIWRHALLNCEGIRETPLVHDVKLLRETADYLNSQIKASLSDANVRHNPKGVTFHFLDNANDVYETSDNSNDRHGLCTKGTPWLNGISIGASAGDWRPERSFHPKQIGHDATGKKLADMFGSDIRFDDAPHVATRWLYELFTTASAVGPSGTQRSYTAGSQVFPNSTSFWVGCDGSPAITDFALPAGYTTATGTVLLDAFTPPDLAVTVTISGDGRQLLRQVLRRGESIVLKLDVSNTRTLRLSAQATSGACTSANIGYGIVADGAVS